MGIREDLEIQVGKVLKDKVHGCDPTYASNVIRHWFRTARKGDPEIDIILTFIPYLRVAERKGYSAFVLSDSFWKELKRTWWSR